MDRKIAVLRITLAAVAALLVFNINYANAQVTFSRDWNAGKRSSPECAISIKSAAAICQMLLNELRAISSCEMRSVVSQRLAQEDESNQDVYIPQHAG